MYNKNYRIIINEKGSIDFPMLSMSRKIISIKVLTILGEIELHVEAILPAFS